MHIFRLIALKQQQHSLLQLLGTIRSFETVSQQLTMKEIHVQKELIIALRGQHLQDEGLQKLHFLLVSEFNF